MSSHSWAGSRAHYTKNLGSWTPTQSRRSAAQRNFQCSGRSSAHLLGARHGQVVEDGGEGVAAQAQQARAAQRGQRCARCALQRAVGLRSRGQRDSWRIDKS